MKEQDVLAAVLGWIGTVGTMVAFILNSSGRLPSLSLTYALLNAVGGSIAGIALVMYGVWPSAMSSFVWAAVGARAAWVAVRRVTDEPAADDLVLAA